MEEKYEVILVSISFREKFLPDAALICRPPIGVPPMFPSLSERSSFLTV